MRPAALFMFVVIGASVVANAGASPVPTHLLKKTDNKELAKLQGRWELKSLQLGNNPIALADWIGMTVEIRGDTMTMKTTDLTCTAKIKLDKVGAVPRLSTTNSNIISITDKPPPPPEDLQYGYTLDGNKLMLATCIGVNGNRGALADPNKPGAETVIMVLNRVAEPK